MTPEFLAQIKQRLLQDKVHLEQDLSDIGIKDAKKPGHYEATYPESGSNSDDDNAMEISTYADELSLVSQLETHLRDVNKALENIDKGKYGVCKYCHKQIDLKRLEARPTSSTCISCKKTLTQEL